MASIYVTREGYPGSHHVDVEAADTAGDVVWASIYITSGEGNAPGSRHVDVETLVTPQNGAIAGIAPHGGGLQDTAGEDGFVKAAFARLATAPTNWHQSTVFALATTAPQDKAIRRQAPVLPRAPLPPRPPPATH